MTPDGPPDDSDTPSAHWVDRGSAIEGRASLQTGERKSPLAIEQTTIIISSVVVISVYIFPRVCVCACLHKILVY